MNFNLLSTTALVTALAASMANADTIVDPDSTGANQVINSGDRLIVGFFGDGTFEVNAENNLNGITSVEITDFIEISNLEPGGDAEVRVIGDGTAGSASITGGAGLRIGGAGDNDASLIVENGGLAEVGGVLSGFFTRGTPAELATTNITVTGDNSRLVSEGGAGIAIGLGRLDFGTDDLTVSDGGGIFSLPTDGAVATDPDVGGIDGFRGDVRIGNNAFGTVGGLTDTITVTGEGSFIEHASGLFFSGGNALVEVLDGGRITQNEVGTLIDDQAALIESSNFSNFGGPGFTPQTAEEIAAGRGINVSTAFEDATLRVAGIDASGNASTVSTTRDVNIGGGSTGIDFVDGANVFAPNSGTVIVAEGGQLLSDGDINVSQKVTADNPIEGSGILTVASGGYVSAGTINVFDGGILDGNGGTLAANVFLDGGTIAPGASPGILNIDGDLDILDGLLEIEIAGTGAGMFDQLNVTGDLIASMGFNIEISFLDNFIPQEGDIFNFLNVAGDSSIFDTPSLINFSVNGGGLFGDNAALNFAGGNLSLIADSIDVAPVPLPAGLPMLVAGLAGVGWIGKRRKAQSAAV